MSTRVEDKNKVETALKQQFPYADYFLINTIHNFDIDVDSYHSMDSLYDITHCSYPFQRMVIYWDGSITICCNDYNCIFDLADMSKNDTILSAWNSGRINIIRQNLLMNTRGKLPVCKHCHFGRVQKVKDSLGV